MAKKHFSKETQDKLKFWNRFIEFYSKELQRDETELVDSISNWLVTTIYGSYGAIGIKFPPIKVKLKNGKEVEVYECWTENAPNDRIEAVLHYDVKLIRRTKIGVVKLSQIQTKYLLGLVQKISKDYYHFNYCMMLREMFEK